MFNNKKFYLYFVLLIRAYYIIRDLILYYKMI